MVRVLMLGWEFPPHISGGLGTACQGICQGLAAADVEILFVVPRALGGEHAPGTRVIGANQVDLEPELAERQVESAGSPVSLVGARSTRSSGTRAARGRKARVSAREKAPAEAPAEALKSYVIDSPLRPYLAAADYPGSTPDEARASRAQESLRERAKRLGKANGAAPLEPEHRDTNGWRVWSEAVGAEAAGAVRPPGASRHAFTGGYGHDLFAEVARYARVVAHLAHRERFDIVHGHDWMTAPAALAAARASGRPLVMHAHALERDRSGDSPDGRVRELERLGLTAADRVVCVSHYTSGVVRRDYGVQPETIRVVHNAVDQGDQRREWHVERTVRGPVVLFLGRVTMQKGPDYFLDAAAQVVRVRPDVNFVLSGSGDMLPRMIEHSARLGLTRHVYFTGFLRGKDVERMYAQADLYVMPSVSEPFGITPLEAMALDVPVILSRQSGVSEIVTHALKVDFWDTRELANKILAVLTYPPLREDLVQAGRDEVRRMRWEVRGTLLRKVYEELL